MSVQSRPEPSPLLPDEDTLVIPDAWFGRIHPRRGDGRVPVPAIEVDDAAVRAVRGLVEGALPAIEEVLASSDTAPELGARVRAHLDGADDPVGAAAVAYIIVDRGRVRGAVSAGFADHWISAHGLAFAARAFAELGGMYFSEGGLRWDGGADGSYVIGSYWWSDETVTRRFRTFMAAASDRDHQEAVDGLAAHRGTPLRRLLAGYLVPTRLDWVDECCADTTYWRVEVLQRMLLRSLGSPGQARLVGRSAHVPEDGAQDTAATLVAGVGPDALGILVRSFIWPDEPEHRASLDAIAQLPTDEAFQTLVDQIGDKAARPALLAAMARFPVRAARLLAPIAAGTSTTSLGVAELIRGRLRSEPGLGAAVLSALPAETRKIVEPLAVTSARYAEAPAHELPRLLTEPPWTRARAKRAPVVIDGLRPPAEQLIAWAPGEREGRLRLAQGLVWTVSGKTPEEWAKLIADYADGCGNPYLEKHIFVSGPEDAARPLVADWHPRETTYAAMVMPAVTARFEVDALPFALRAAMSAPAHRADLLLPYRDAAVAALMADWFARLSGARESARRWFQRHGLDAVPLLVPAALGKAGGERRNAEGALRLLAADQGDEAVCAAAGVYGDEAAQAVRTMLAMDPLEIVPARIPKPPEWADLDALPQILLRGRESALPASAVGHLLTMLAMSKPGEEYAGLDVVRDLCDPASLAEFSWALYLRWEGRGAPSKDGWAFSQLGVLGDDGTVRRLSPVIRALPGEGGHVKAVRGLDVLAAIGTDVALTHLYGIAQKLKYKGLKTKAQEKISALAAARGLSEEQLADRAVPDFGLDAEGGMAFDYGPRRFQVGFDEQLVPHVVTEDGKRRKSLPKPAATDDPALAPTAHAAFAGLKKDVKTVAVEQIRRLEAAMTAGRRWTADEFTGLFVAHPLLWHIVRRLVWLAEHDGRATAFRIAEDRTFADADDDAFSLPEGARIGVAHPVHLGEALGAWSELFSDYEILQPFPQLGRTVHALTEKEGASARLERFDGLTIPYGKAKGISQSRWHSDQDGAWIARADPAGRHVVARLSPGIRYSYYEGISEEQTIEAVWIASHPTREPDPHEPLRFDDLDPVTASEVIADLGSLTGSP